MQTSQVHSIPNLSAPWTLIVHNTTITPEGAINWGHKSVRTPGQLIGYVKRYGKTNGGLANWHIVPFTDIRDGSIWYHLYIA